MLSGSCHHDMARPEFADGGDVEGSCPCIEQDRQCTYNVTLWCVRLSIVARLQTTIRSFCIVALHISVSNAFMTIL
jgi:hypothetical protein